jgi:hypothetical protein
LTADRILLLPLGALAPTLRLMSRDKPRGNLRDFRIDRSLTPELSTPRDLPAKSLTPKKEVISSVRARSSATEWTQEDENHASNFSESPSLPTTPVAESLWGEWKNDLADENLPPTKKASAPIVEKKLHAESLPAQEDVEEFDGHARAEIARSLNWIEDLALAERQAERTGVVDFTNSYQKQDLLKARTREYTAQLSKSFREAIENFNALRKAPAHAIQFYRVSKTAEDFMIFRNGVKLVISGARAGRVLFAFNQYLGQIFAPTQSAAIEIEADWGPFDQLFWSYKGERVNVDELVRYFLTEFSRQSFK